MAAKRSDCGGKNRRASWNGSAVGAALTGRTLTGPADYALPRDMRHTHSTWMRKRMQTATHARAGLARALST